MGEQLLEPDPGVSGMPSVKGQSSSVGSVHPIRGGFHDLLQEPVGAGGVPGGDSEPPDRLSWPMDEASKPPDDDGGLLDETSWETTRYLAAATQLDLSYARLVVSEIVGWDSASWMQ